MKKLFLCLAVLLLAVPAFCADTCVQGGVEKFNQTTSRVIITCTADAAAPGAFSKTLDLSNLEGNWLYELRTYPGSTAPTDGADITITDENGMDILGTAGTDKVDSTSDLRFFPLNTSGNPAYWPVTDTAPTLAVTNNTDASAVFYIELIFTE